MDVNVKKRKIWIDCDPGIDDAVALAMAAASQDALQLCGISTVAGNQTSNRVTENALKLADFLHLNVPVVRGADGPLLREIEVADDIHGATGLGNCRLPEASRTLAADNGLLFLRNTIMALPKDEKITLVPTGPLTNIALLFKVFPEVKPRIEQLVLMGGSSGEGNVTPFAEFNIWVDPEAAALVFHCGLPIVMCGLDVTLKSGLNHAQVNELSKSSSPLKHAYGEMLAFYLNTTEKENRELVCIHDAVTILYLTNPELFGGETVFVDVDCSEKRRGQTVSRPAVSAGKSAIFTDYSTSAGDFSNCPKVSTGSKPAAVFMLNQVNLPEFQKILLSKLDSLSTMPYFRN